MEKVTVQGKATLRVSSGNGKVGNTDWVSEWEAPYPSGIAQNQG